MVLQDIIHDINKSSGLVNYLEQLEKSYISNLECKSFLVPILSKLISVASKSDILIISSSENSSTEMLNWINNLTGDFENTLFFPQKKEHSNSSKNKERFEFISRFRKTSSNKIITSTLNSALESLPSPSTLRSKSIKLNTQDSINLNSLSEK